MQKVNFGATRFLLLITIVSLGVAFMSCVAAGVENEVTINGYPTITHDPARGWDNFDSYVLFNLYSPLTYPTPDGAIGPHIAEEWLSSSDATTWHCVLREGIKFHDGTELTAEDVVFSMKRFQALESGYYTLFSFVTDVSAGSKYVVRFELNKSVSTLPEIALRFFILNRDLVMQHTEPGDYGEFGDYGVEWLKTHDAGSGPYYIAEHKPNESLVARRFTDYFLGWENWKPNLRPIDEVRFTFTNEASTLKTLMKSREHDMTNMWQSIDTYRALDKIEEIHLFNNELGLIYMVPMNTQKAPTDDVHFRRAVQYAFDYEALFQLVPGSKYAGPWPSGLPGFDPDLPLPRQDFDRAREELEKSKYDPGEVTFVMNYISGLTLYEQTALIVQSTLAQLGVDVEILPAPWPRVEEMLRTPETTPNGSMLAFMPRYPSADYFLFTVYHPDAVAGLADTMHWMKSEELGKKIDKTREVLDPSTRAEMYWELQDEIQDLALGIYVSESPGIHAVQDYIVGPKEMYPLHGPAFNFRNFQIDLELKEQMTGG